MARYTGPRVRKMRALDCLLPGLSPKTSDRRPYRPGQHGSVRMRPQKQSDFKKQLVERQKLRFNYGVSEGQLRRLVLEARRMRGRPDDNVLTLLESRFDNVVFRAGFAPSIPAARQLIVHGHVLVDGRRLDRPSARLKVGQKITLRTGSLAIPTVVASWPAPRWEIPSWLERDVDAGQATLRAKPDSSGVLVLVQASLVIEHYAARI